MVSFSRRINLKIYLVFSAQADQRTTASWTRAQTIPSILSLDRSLRDQPRYAQSNQLAIWVPVKCTMTDGNQSWRQQARHSLRTLILKCWGVLTDRPGRSIPSHPSENALLVDDSDDDDRSISWNRALELAASSRWPESNSGCSTSFGELGSALKQAQRGDGKTRRWRVIKAHRVTGKFALASFEEFVHLVHQIVAKANETIDQISPGSQPGSGGHEEEENWNAFAKASA